MENKNNDIQEFNIPLVYDDTIDTANITNVMLIDDTVYQADIFYNAGYLETEAKSGVHKGTYKVFVNYIPMADITQLHPDLIPLRVEK